MNPLFQRYLSDLEAAMSRLQPEQRVDTLREIEVHFADAAAAGASPEEVIARLGTPRLLAAALIAESLDQETGAPPVHAWRVLVTSLFIAASSLTSLMVVPLLVVAAAGFGLVAVLSPVAGVLRTFGASWIQIDFGPGRTLPAEWSIPFMIGMAVVSAAVALGAYRVLRLYMRIVGRGYRAVLARPAGVLGSSA